MAEAPVAPDVHEPLDVHGYLGAEGTLHLIIPFDLPPKEVDLLVIQILSPAVRVYSAGLEDVPGSSPPDPIDIGQGHLDPLASG
jgi:hypothetical protein